MQNSKKDIKNLQLDKNFKLTTEQVDKEELLDLFAEGAENLLPLIDNMDKNQLQRVLGILVFAPIMEHPTKKPKGMLEASMIINFLRLQDYKIALAELLDDEVEERAEKLKEKDTGKD